MLFLGKYRKNGDFDQITLKMLKNGKFGQNTPKSPNLAKTPKNTKIHPKMVKIGGVFLPIFYFFLSVFQPQ